MKFKVKKKSNIKCGETKDKIKEKTKTVKLSYVLRDIWYL